MSTDILVVDDGHHAHFQVNGRPWRGSRLILVSYHHEVYCESHRGSSFPCSYKEAVERGFPIDRISDWKQEELEMFSEAFCPITKECYEQRCKEAEDLYKQDRHRRESSMIQKSRRLFVNDVVLNGLCENDERLQDIRDEQQTRMMTKITAKWNLIELSNYEQQEALKYEYRRGNMSSDEYLQREAAICKKTDEDFNDLEEETRSDVSVLREHIRGLLLYILEGHEDDYETDVAQPITIDFPLEFEDEDECPVCKEEKYEKTYLLRLPCGHTLCKACFEGIKEQVCPKCRHPIDRNLIKRKKVVG